MMLINEYCFNLIHYVVVIIYITCCKYDCFATENDWLSQKLFLNINSIQTYLLLTIQHGDLLNRKKKIVTHLV